MGDEQSPAFEGVWNTLVQRGLPPGLHEQTTVTPQHYRDDEITLASPPGKVDLRVEQLPLIRVADDGDLKVGELLGVGGMGSVHVARQAALQRDVAIKRLTRPDEATHLEALLREAVITGALEHPNIVPVHALGRDEDGHPVLVMKRIQGELWSAKLDKAPLETHLEILMDVCNALHYAHDRGVVHLDLKPQNVLIGDFGEVSLLDWGIARRIDDPPPGVMLGTPAYLAPEMVRNGPLTPQSDVYLLGAMLHRVLTGKARHRGKTTYKVLSSAYHSKPVAYGPDVPPELAELCNRATHKDPAERPASALAFREALEAFERHRSSAQLAQVAAGRLVGLSELLAQEAADPREARDVAGTMRFGLREALAQWPDNAAARTALMDLSELMVRWEIEQGSPDEAERNLSELRELGPEGAAREARLAEEVADTLRHARALAKLGRQMDLSVGSGLRVALVLVIGFLGTIGGTAVLVAVRFGGVPLSHRLNAGVAFGGAVVFTLVLWMIRARVMTTVANKRVWYMLLLSAWAFVINRATAPLMDLTVEQTVAQELLLGAVAAGMFGITVDMRLFVGCGLLVAASLAAAWFPAIALEIAIAAIASSGVIGVAALWHWMR